MENNNDAIKRDALDELLFGIADEADRGVDYDAMLETIKKKASARKKRAGFVKYGTMAAVAVIMLAVGGMWIRENALVSYDTAAAADKAVMQSESAECVESVYDGYDTNVDYASGDTAPAVGYSYSDSDGYESSAVTSATTSSAAEAEEYIQCFYQDMVLPAIDFGTYYEFTLDDETGLELKIYGCAEEDAEYYLKETAAIYGVNVDMNAMNMVSDNGITVALSLDGDTLTVSAQK